MPLTLLVALSARNIVRHRRRNLMLLLAIAIAVSTVLLANTFIRGMQYDMRDQSVGSLSGHIKVQAPGYADEPGIGRGFALAADWQEGTDAAAIAGWAARVRVPAVIMSERENRGIQLVGIDPLQETISFLGSAVIEGDRLQGPDDKRILIGKEMANQLETAVNRRLVIITQGADGLNREAGFRIAGTFDAEGTGLEKAYVFTGVRALQGLVDDAVITELSVRLTDDQFQPQVLRSLTDVFAGLDVKTWQEMDPMAAAVFLFADAAIFLYFLIVMTALVFGLVNTLVTSVMERVREMGMLRAVGMRPGAVIAQVVLESTFIMAIGVVIGLAFGFGVYQLLPPEIDLSRWGEGFEAFNIPVKLHLRLYASDMLLVAILSLVFGVLASLYPAKKAVKLSPVEALRR